MQWKLHSDQAAGADFPKLHCAATEFFSPEGNLGQDSYPRWPDLSFGVIPLLTAAVPSHLLLRHWVYHLFKEEILKIGISQWLDKHSLAPPKLQTPPSKTNQSWLCECSFTRHENMKTLLVDHQVPCWDCTNGLPTPVCHLLTSQNQSQTCPGKMLELHHKEVELTSWRAYFGFSESVTLPSVRRKDDWLSYSWIRRDILIWRYSEKSVYSVNTDC